MTIVNKTTKNTVKIAAPPSKAHTLRSLFIAALAKGTTTIKNPLLGQDQTNAIRCLKQLGIQINQKENSITLTGCDGQFEPVEKNTKLNVGESGVGANFLTAAACLSTKPVTLTGQGRLLRRPIDELVDALTQLGCRIDYLGKHGFPPVKIYGQGIKGGTAKMRGHRTSQYFSSLAVSSPYAQNPVTINCTDQMTEKPYFDITLDMMAKFSVNAKNQNYKTITVPNNKQYRAKKTYSVEGDYSSASYFMLAAAVCPLKVTVTNLNIDSQQGDKAFVEIMKKMGCDIKQTKTTVTVTGQNLNAIDIDMSDIPDLVPSVAIAAAFAKGTTNITNIGHLRHKECDRLAVVASQLNKMDAKVTSNADSLAITGTDSLHGTTIDPYNDHRIAMSFAIAGLALGNQKIQNPKCVAKSFPDFWDKLKAFQ